MARRPLVSRTIEPTNDLLSALESALESADQVFSGWSCPASTECCRFGVTGREPYVTSIELAAIHRAIGARGGPRSWKRASALGEPRPPGALPLVQDERRCPLLNVEGRCSIYASRPLG